MKRRNPIARYSGRINKPRVFADKRKELKVYEKEAELYEHYANQLEEELRQEESEIQEG